MKLLLCLLISLLLPIKTVAAPPADQPPKTDEREIKLTKFFDHYKCPKPYYVETYLRSADRYNIPYTLLPAISIQESSCGRHFRYSNFWGWNSAHTGFTSVPAGIEYVSNQLSTGKYYRGKSLTGKLNSYNPNKAYPPKIEKLMHEIENNN